MKIVHLLDKDGHHTHCGVPYKEVRNSPYRAGELLTLQPEKTTCRECVEILLSE